MIYAGYYSDNFVGANGGLQQATPFTVYEADGVTLSTLWSSRTKAAFVDNPSRTDELGEGSFYTTPGLHVIECNDGTVTVMVGEDPGDDDGTGGMLTDYIGKTEPVGLVGGPTLFDPSSTDWDDGAYLRMFRPSDGQPGAIDFVYGSGGAFCSFTSGTKTSDGSYISGVASFTQSDGTSHQWTEFYHVAQVDPWDGSNGQCRTVLGIDGDWGAGYMSKLFIEVNATDMDFVIQAQAGQTGPEFRVQTPAGASTFQVNGNGTVGFFGHPLVGLQTGVAVSAAGIHAALVNLGLITA